MKTFSISLILLILITSLFAGKGEIGGVICLGYMGFPDAPDGIGLGLGPRVEYPIATDWLRIGGELNYFRLAPGFLLEISDPAYFHDLSFLVDLGFGKGNSKWQFGLGLHNMSRTYTDSASDEQKQKNGSWTKLGFHIGQSNRFYLSKGLTGVQDTRIIFASLGKEEQSYYFNAQVTFGVLFSAF